MVLRTNGGIPVAATTRDELIECSEEILGGTPVFAGTRVPIRTLLDYLESGERLDDFLDDFPSVRRESALRVLELAREALLTQVHACAS